MAPLCEPFLSSHSRCSWSRCCISSFITSCLQLKSAIRILFLLTEVSAIQVNQHQSMTKGIKLMRKWRTESYTWKIHSKWTLSVGLCFQRVAFSGYVPVYSLKSRKLFNPIRIPYIRLLLVKLLRFSNVSAVLEILEKWTGRFTAVSFIISIVRFGVFFFTHFLTNF